MLDIDRGAIPEAFGLKSNMDRSTRHPDVRLDIFPGEILRCAHATEQTRFAAAKEVENADRLTALLDWTEDSES